MTDANLSFIDAPDYENPNDLGSDNTYEIIIEATDLAGTTRSFAISINVQDKIYTQKAQLFASDAEENDRFGDAVAISDDYMIVGAAQEDTYGSNAGAAYLYKINSDNSLSEIQKITASDAEAGDYFGYSVAISDSYVVIVAYQENGNSTDAGAAYVYKINSDDSVSEIEKITASDAGSSDYFGASVAISNQYIVVGAYSNDTNASNAGAAYVYKIADDDSSISELQQITASDAEANDYFGTSVAISDNFIVVGAYLEDTNGSNAGAAYVYEINSDDTVSQIQKITASDAEADDYFGKSVSISNAYVIVGAYREDTNASNSGAAYVYKIADDNSSVETLQKITASDAEAFDYFGYSVSVSGSYILVGAYDKDTEAYDSGKAYLYEIANDDSINTVESMIASDAQSDDEFASSVSIFNNNIAIGAYREDTKGSSAGEAYFFSYDFSD